MATPDRFPLPQVPDSTRKPEWLKVRLPNGEGYERVKGIIKKTKLATVCEEARCLSLMPEPTTLPVINRAGCPFDMEATAALVAATDLVITVDTMIAHLAGAMGKPVWLLLNANPDWRWPTEGIRTPWYPSMRIYAQQKIGGWEPVVQQVRRDLAARHGVSIGD